MLRDQTASVIRRYQQRESGTNTTLIPQGREKSPVALPSPLNTNIASSLEDQALCFLFSTLVLRPTSDWRTSHGHLDFLLPFYQRAPRDSPLALATSWLGVLTLGACTKGKPYAAEHLLLSRVLSGTLTATADPIQSTSDETLKTVIMLQYGEHARARRYKASLPSSTHQKGAEALIRKRGTLNFRDSTALSLFAAVRHNAVELSLQDSDNYAARRGSMDEGWDLWNLPFQSANESEQYTSQWPKSYNPATELDAHGVTLVTLGRQLELLNKEDLEQSIRTLGAIHEGLSQLLNRLLSWSQGVPPEWLPAEVTDFHHAYPSPDIAYLFDQWFLLRLKTIHLILKSSMRAKCNDPLLLKTHYDHAIQLVDRIVASEYSILQLRRGGREAPLLNNNDIDCLPGGENGSIDQARVSPNRIIYLGFPRATVQQCKASRQGSRLLEQILSCLCHDLAKALGGLDLCDGIAAQYRPRLEWARRELGTIRKAAPLQKDI